MTATKINDLVALGMAVVEVAAPVAGGCSCRLRGDCPAVGKHPVGNAWLKRAIANRRHRPDWLPPCARYTPATSYGLVPLKGSGVVVIDRDDPSVRLPMPDTFEVHRPSADPRKGHYYFVLDSGIAEDDVPRTFSGGEVRIAESGHVVGPGSRHASGDIYEANGLPVGTFDRELFDALKALPGVKRGANGAVEAVLGSRRTWLASQARKFRGWDYAPEDIVDELRRLNEDVCSPPLTDREFADVERAVGWAMKNVAPDAAARLTRSKRSRPTANNPWGWMK